MTFLMDYAIAELISNLQTIIGLYPSIPHKAGLEALEKAVNN